MAWASVASLGSTHTVGPPELRAAAASAFSRHQEKPLGVCPQIVEVPKISLSMLVPPLPLCDRAGRGQAVASSCLTAQLCCPGPRWRLGWKAKPSLISGMSGQPEQTNPWGQLEQNSRNTDHHGALDIQCLRGYCRGPKWEEESSRVDTVCPIKDQP